VDIGRPPLIQMTYLTAGDTAAAANQPVEAAVNTKKED
jgi:hypothetical protein